MATAGGPVNLSPSAEATARERIGLGPRRFGRAAGLQKRKSISFLGWADLELHVLSQALGWSKSQIATSASTGETRHQSFGFRARTRTLAAYAFTLYRARRSSSRECSAAPA